MSQHTTTTAGGKRNEWISKSIIKRCRRRIAVPYIYISSHSDLDAVFCNRRAPSTLIQSRPFPFCFCLFFPFFSFPVGLVISFMEQSPLLLASLATRVSSFYKSREATCPPERERENKSDNKTRRKSFSLSVASRNKNKEKQVRPTFKCRWWLQHSTVVPGALVNILKKKRKKTCSTGSYFYFLFFLRSSCFHYWHSEATRVRNGIKGRPTLIRRHYASRNWIGRQFSRPPPDRSSANISTVSSVLHYFCVYFPLHNGRKRRARFERKTNWAYSFSIVEEKIKNKDFFPDLTTLSDTTNPIKGKEKIADGTSFSSFLSFFFFFFFFLQTALPFGHAIV